MVLINSSKFICQSLPEFDDSPSTADATLFRQVIGQLQYLAFTKPFAVQS